MHQTVTPALDHVVINVHDALDSARDAYAALGFNLQPRGHHSLGSSNHLAVFGDTYLELLGYEPDRAQQRTDLWQAPVGLTGLVFKTTDSLALHEHLKSLGLDGDPPGEFHRPVTLPDGSQQPARFRTVRIASDLVPNGRTFFCHHFTPELVWIDAWRQHPNQVTDISQFTIAATDPEAASQPYARLFGAHNVQADADGGRTLAAGKAIVRFLPIAQAALQFPGARIDPGDTQRMVALTLRTRSLQAVRDTLAAGDITPQAQTPERIVVRAADANGVVLVFEQEHAA